MNRAHRQSSIPAIRLLTVIGCALASAVTLVASSGGSQAATPQRTAAPRPGTWTKLGLSQTAPPELWRGPDNRDWVVWSAPGGSHYQLAIIAPNGALAVKPKTIVSGWSSVTAQPTLLANGKSPLLVFSGQDNIVGPLSDGCVVGALPASPSWQIQSWSLSANCTFSNVGYGDATENKSGQLSAAWAGGAGAEYRLGISGTIPATGSDQQISLPSAHADSLALANDRFGNGDTYAAFYRFFSSPASKDGVYVKDLTTNGAVLKAPGSGTESVTYPARPQRVALANVSRHGGGIYLAYCSNAGTCSTFLLWKAGAKKAIKIPHTKLAIGLAMSQGPAGRLWLAWYDEQNNRVYAVRTNKADNRFGPLESFKVPCFADGNTHLALTSGSFGRVDIGFECLSAKQTKETTYVTQALTGLTINASPGKITNSHAVSVTFTVTDAGDPVAGASVKADGKTVHTASNGKVTVTFAKNTEAGRYSAIASAWQLPQRHHDGAGEQLIRGRSDDDGGSQLGADGQSRR